MKKISISILLLSTLSLALFTSGCKAPDTETTSAEQNPGSAPEFLELIDVIKKGDVNRAKTIIAEKKANINATDQKGLTPLLYAALYEQEPIVKDLLAAGAHVNARSPFKSSALHYAAYMGNEQIAKDLINAGADVKATDNYKNTPLHLSENIKHPQVSKLLTDKGADKNAENEVPVLNNGQPTLSKEKPLPFYMADPIKSMFSLLFSVDDAALLEALAKTKGVDINEFPPNPDGTTPPAPLVTAYAFKRPGLIQGLKDLKPDPAKIDLFKAIWPTVTVDNFRELLDYTNGDKIKDASGLPLWLQAIYSQRPDILLLLLERGLDPSDKITYGGQDETLLDRSLLMADQDLLKDPKYLTLIDTLLGKNAKLGHYGNTRLNDFLVQLAKYAQLNGATPLIKKLYLGAVAKGGNVNQPQLTNLYKKGVTKIMAQP